MRRALLAVAATVAMVVGLLHYKSGSVPKSLRIANVGAQPESSPSSPPAAGASPATGSGGSSPDAGGTPAAGSGGTRTIAGPVEENRFGPVQVQIQVSGRRITSVKTLELPADRARSAYISSVAGPILTQEALQAQNASIHSVSGASYTSDSFAQSLQAALTQAGL